ncbi:MAG: TerB family tellurite resistance protein [Acidiferrobacterales bacterium]|nr:TerB family tellurite resistance protein [Acidiferrobacterales bacterium]
MLTNLRINLTTFLSVEDVTEGNDSVARTSNAAAALLLEAAQADNEIDEAELAQIELSLVNNLGVNSENVKQIVSGAQKQLDHATCLHEITKIINQNWSVNDKINLIESMWKVVLSDQHLDAHEQHLMRKIKGLLHIPQTEYIAAKLRAKDALGTN